MNDAVFYKVVVQEGKKFYSCFTELEELRVEYVVGRKSEPLLSGSKIFIFPNSDDAIDYAKALDFDGSQKIVVLEGEATGLQLAPDFIPYVPACASRNLLALIQDFWGEQQSDIVKLMGRKMVKSPAGSMLCENYTARSVVYHNRKVRSRSAVKRHDYRAWQYKKAA